MSESVVECCHFCNGPVLGETSDIFNLENVFRAVCKICRDCFDSKSLPNSYTALPPPDPDERKLNWISQILQTDPSLDPFKKSLSKICKLYTFSGQSAVVPISKALEKVKISSDLRPEFKWLLNAILAILTSQYSYLENFIADRPTGLLNARIIVGVAWVCSEDPKISKIERLYPALLEVLPICLQNESRYVFPWEVEILSWSVRHCLAWNMETKFTCKNMEIMLSKILDHDQSISWTSFDLMNAVVECVSIAAMLEGKGGSQDAISSPVLSIDFQESTFDELLIFLAAIQRSDIEGVMKFIDLLESSATSWKKSILTITCLVRLEDILKNDGFKSERRKIKSIMKKCRNWNQLFIHHLKWIDYLLKMEQSNSDWTKDVSSVHEILSLSRQSFDRALIEEVSHFMWRMQLKSLSALDRTTCQMILDALEDVQSPDFDLRRLWSLQLSLQCESEFLLMRSHAEVTRANRYALDDRAKNECDFYVTRVSLRAHPASHDQNIAKLYHISDQARELFKLKRVQDFTFHVLRMFDLVCKPPEDVHLLILSKKCSELIVHVAKLKVESPFLSPQAINCLYDVMLLCDEAKFETMVYLASNLIINVLSQLESTINFVSRMQLEANLSKIEFIAKHGINEIKSTMPKALTQAMSMVEKLQIKPLAVRSLFRISKLISKLPEEDIKIILEPCKAMIPVMIRYVHDMDPLVSAHIMSTFIHLLEQSSSGIVGPNPKISKNQRKPPAENTAQTTAINDMEAACLELIMKVEKFDELYAHIRNWIALKIFRESDKLACETWTFRQKVVLVMVVLVENFAVFVASVLEMINDPLSKIQNSLDLDDSTLIIQLMDIVAEKGYGIRMDSNFLRLIHSERQFAWRISWLNIIWRRSNQNQAQTLEWLLDVLDDCEKVFEKFASCRSSQLMVNTEIWCISLWCQAFQMAIKSVHSTGKQSSMDTKLPSVNMILNYASKKEWPAESLIWYMLSDTAVLAIRELWRNKDFEHAKQCKSLARSVLPSGLWPDHLFTNLTQTN